MHRLSLVQNCTPGLATFCFTNTKIPKLRFFVCTSNTSILWRNYMFVREQLTLSRVTFTSQLESFSVDFILSKRSKSQPPWPKSPRYITSFSRTYLKSLPLMLSTLPRRFQCSTSAVKMTISVSVLLTSAALIIANCHRQRFYLSRPYCCLFFCSFMTSRLKPETRLSLSMWSETRYPSIKLGLILLSPLSECIKLI